MSKIKDFRSTTPANLSVGDVVRFIKVPYFTDDERLYYYNDTVIGFEPTKSGKRVRVIFKDKGKYPMIGWNTPLETSPAGFWERISKERGWKDEQK